MAATLEELTEQAMALPPDARARLAALLVESLDAEVLDAGDRLWLAEAKRRRDAVRRGHVQTISGEEALQRVRDALR
jgi:putative addiction module component (TIGR02574 family)